MKENVKQDDISFEQALKEIETIVRKLESENSDLDKSIADYEKGSALIKICEKKLSAAKMKVEKIVKDQNGNVTLEEFKD